MTLLDVAAAPATPPDAGGDPTWYLVWDLVLNGLAAAGSLVAVFVAIVLAVRAARDQNAQREEQQRVQAERIVLLRVMSARKPYLLLRNESGLTISAIRFYAVGSPVPVDPTESPSVLEVLRSGHEKMRYLRSAGDRRKVAVVEFDDALGRTWVRTAEGELYRTHRMPGVNVSVKVDAAFNGPTRVVTALALHTQPGGKLLELFPSPSTWPWRKHDQARWFRAYLSGLTGRTKSADRPMSET